MSRRLQGATREQIERGAKHLFDIRQYHLGEFVDVEPDPAVCVDQDTLQAADSAAIADRAGLEVDVVDRVLEALAEFECDRHPWRDPRELVRLYYVEGLTQTEVADELGCGQKAISRWMHRYGIEPGRGRPEGFRGRQSGGESSR